MTNPGVHHALCVFLAFLIAAPSGLAQDPNAPPAKPQLPQAAGQGISVGVLEGNNTVNSIPLLQSNAPIVEVRDENEFPIEGAVVVFTLPAQGPGGIFTNGQTSYTTRSDAHGQALAPLFTPRLPGKFQIRVTATAGIRKAEAVITQTNSTGDYAGPAVAKRPFYKKKLPLILIGVGVAGIVVGVVLLTRSSGNAAKSAVTITPGSPIFH